MEDSSDEVFMDALKFTPNVSPKVNNSRYTLYQSTMELETLSPNEEAGLVRLNSFKKQLSPGPKPLCKHFRDGIRTVDFVLVWMEKSNDGAAAQRRQIFESHLAGEGIELEEEVYDKLHFVKLHAPRDVLRRYTEVLHLRMPMKEIEGQEESYDGSDDLISDVKSILSKLFACVQLDESVFPRPNNKLSAEYSRDKSYLFEEDSDDFFTSQVRTLVVDFILERTSFGKSSDTCLGIERLISEGVYRAAYPLHDGGYNEPGTLRSLLLREWAEVSKWAMYQPVDQIREYFGVKFALYFAWLGFYTHMLVPASILGVLVVIYGAATIHTDSLSKEICELGSNITMCPLCDRHCDYWALSDTCTYAKVTYLFDNPVTVVFAVFMSFWTTIFLELWKRYSASIVHRWGLSDFSVDAEPPRPQYTARLNQRPKVAYKVNVVTGQKEPYVPFWSVKLPNTLISFSVVLLLVMLALAAVCGVVLYRMSLLASLSMNTDTEQFSNYAILVVPATAAVINLVCIMALNWVYNRLAATLTELELHRTQNEFDESLTLKIYLFQFVNYYTSIFYIAFLKGKFVGYPAKYNRVFGLRQEECNPGGCLMELSIQLAVIMVGQQAVNSVLEMLLPLLWKTLNTLTVKAGLEKADPDKKDNIVDPLNKQWTQDFKLLDWGPNGLFYEYLEMVMQYGFVTIFVSAFPLAPLFALINNVFEMRLDAKKFLKFYRRPVPKRAPNIGVWYRILNVLARIAVISNAFIIAFSSNLIPKIVYAAWFPNHHDEGLLEFTLSHFDTRDFANGTAPLSPSQNVSSCRYHAFREPPDAANRYKKTIIYWNILFARLLFIVLFQNVVSFCMIAVQWIIPDVPSRVKEQIRREAFLTSELIIQHERIQAKKLLARCSPREVVSEG